MTTDAVRKDMLIAAPRDRVWACLTDPDLLAGWLMRNDFQPSVGHRFTFTTEPSGDFDGAVRCTVVEVEPPQRLVFTWHANSMPAETRVTIELEPDGAATRLRLLHEGFERQEDRSAALLDDHAEGWDDHLGMLRRQAEEDAQGGQRISGAPDWSRFRLHVAIDAHPSTVLDRWRTAAGWQSFFVETLRIRTPDGRQKELDDPAAAGDRYTGRWHNGRRLAGRFLAADADHVRFTFDESTVEVTARPWGEGCLLRLEQSGIPEDETSRMHVHANCRGGWVYFMTVLKVLLEHGIDARDTTRETGSSFSTYFVSGPE